MYNEIFLCGMNKSKFDEDCSGFYTGRLIYMDGLGYHIFDLVRFYPFLINIFNTDNVNLKMVEFISQLLLGFLQFQFIDRRIHITTFAGLRFTTLFSTYHDKSEDIPFPLLPNR